MEKFKFKPPTTKSVWDEWLDREIERTKDYLYGYELREKKSKIHRKYKS